MGTTICPRCKQVVDYEDLLPDGICEECVNDAIRNKKVKSMYYKAPPYKRIRTATERVK